MFSSAMIVPVTSAANAASAVHEQQQQVGPPCESARMRQRAKQVQIGKLTLGYENYSEQVPKNGRIPGVHLNTPSTSPRSNRTLSKRAFEVVLRNWRQFLHTFDNAGTAEWNPDQEQHENNTHTTSPTSQQSFAFPPSGDSHLQPSSCVAAQPHPWYPAFNVNTHCQPLARTEKLTVPCLPDVQNCSGSIVPPLPLHMMFFDATPVRYSANEYGKPLAPAEAPRVPLADESHNSNMTRPHYASSGSSASLSSARSVSTALTAVTEDAPRLDKIPLLGNANGAQTCPSLPVDTQRNRASLASLFPSEPEAPEELQTPTVPITHQPYTAGITYVLPPSPRNVVPGRPGCRFNEGRSTQDFDVDNSFNATPASNIDELTSALIAFT